MPIPAKLAEAFAPLGLNPPCVEHVAVATVEAARALREHMPGTHVKNLFFKDAGGQLWLVVVPAEPMMDIKALAGLIGSKRLSFGSAELLGDVLGVQPGSVTPLCVMNDTARRVRAVLHAGMMQDEALLIHPLINTATLRMPPADVRRFMQTHHTTPAEIDLSAAFKTA